MATTIRLLLILSLLLAPRLAGAAELPADPMAAIRGDRWADAQDAATPHEQREMAKTRASAARPATSGTLACVGAVYLENWAACVTYISTMTSTEAY